MWIYSKSFLLEVILIHDSGLKNKIYYEGTMPERFSIPVENVSQDPVTVQSILLNGIFINEEKFMQVFKVQTGQDMRQTTRITKNSLLHFDLFSINAITYLLYLGNTIY